MNTLADVAEVGPVLGYLRSADASLEAFYLFYSKTFVAELEKGVRIVPKIQAYEVRTHFITTNIIPKTNHKAILLPSGLELRNIIPYSTEQT